jgi:hypothetical protein
MRNIRALAARAGRTALGSSRITIGLPLDGEG